MTTNVNSLKSSVVDLTEKAQVSGSLGFDWAMIAVCTWLISGVYADGWHTITCG